MSRKHFDFSFYGKYVSLWLLYFNKFSLNKKQLNNTCLSLENCEMILSISLSSSYHTFDTECSYCYKPITELEEYRQSLMNKERTESNEHNPHNHGSIFKLSKKICSIIVKIFNNITLISRFIEKANCKAWMRSQRSHLWSPLRSPPQRKSQ